MVLRDELIDKHLNKSFVPGKSAKAFGQKTLYHDDFLAKMSPLDETKNSRQLVTNIKLEHFNTQTGSCAHCDAAVETKSNPVILFQARTSSKCLREKSNHCGALSGARCRTTSCNRPKTRNKLKEFYFALAMRETDSRRKDRRNFRRVSISIEARLQSVYEKYPPRSC